jgi:hypothetical protein
VLLVADTHLTAGQAWRVVARLGDRLADADLIVHAGDITDAAVLRELERSAPVHAVRGNNDVVGDVRSLPERVRVDVDGCIVGVVHDTGPAAGRAARVRAQFPDVDVVVFGHSHVPWHETHVRSDGHVQHHVNPGSAVRHAIVIFLSGLTSRGQGHCCASG